MYAQKTGLFHFTVTFVASSGSTPLQSAGVESDAIIHQAPKEHYWPGMFAWVQHIRRWQHVEFCLGCFFFYFFSLSL